MGDAQQRDVRTKISDRLQELGIELPAATRPVGSYTTAVRSGDLLFLSGHICREYGDVVTGKTGPGGAHETARACELARTCALELLATIDAAVGLDSVVRVVKLVGFVNATAEFTEHSRVINGASDFIHDVFGEAGLHARSAVGVASLPLDATVEVEAIVQLSPLS